MAFPPDSGPAKVVTDHQQRVMSLANVNDTEIWSGSGHGVILVHSAAVYCHVTW